jgi:hypothetical protein
VVVVGSRLGQAKDGVGRPAEGFGDGGRNRPIRKKEGGERASERARRRKKEMEECVRVGSGRVGSVFSGSSLTCTNQTQTHPGYLLGP